MNPIIQRRNCVNKLLGLFVLARALCILENCPSYRNISYASIPLIPPEGRGNPLGNSYRMITFPMYPLCDGLSYFSIDYFSFYENDDAAKPIMAVRMIFSSHWVSTPDAFCNGWLPPNDM